MYGRADCMAEEIGIVEKIGMAVETGRADEIGKEGKLVWKS